MFSWCVGTCDEWSWSRSSWKKHCLQNDLGSPRIPETPCRDSVHPCPLVGIFGRGCDTGLFEIHADILRMNTSIRYSGCFSTPRMGGTPVYVPKGTAPLNVRQLLPFTGFRPGLLVSSSFHCPPLFFGHQGSTLEL